MNQDLNEALLIAEGKTMMLPEKRHIKALVNELQRFEKYEGNLLEFQNRTWNYDENTETPYGTH